jgi:hypothetical protein
MRGVPRVAAAAALPIANGSGLTCAQAVRFDRECSWSTLNHGSAAGLGGAGEAAAAAYYASVASLFASWGVAVVKGDCFFPPLPSNRTQPHGFFDSDLVAFTSSMKTAGIVSSAHPAAAAIPRLTKTDDGL